LSLLALAFLFLIFFLFNNRISKQIFLFKVKIESLQAKEVQLEATALNVKLNDLQGRIGKDLLKKDVHNDRLFLNLARNSNLKIVSYLPEEFNNQNYCKTKYKLNFKGEFGDVYNFFNQLAEVKTTLKCCQLKLTNQDGVINIETTYNCYLSNEKPN
jgi:hypothetical protein